MKVWNYIKITKISASGTLTRFGKSNNSMNQVIKIVFSSINPEFNHISKVPLPCTMKHSQVLRIRTWTSLRGHSSACHLAIWCDSVHKTPLSWVLLQKPLIFQTRATWLHSGEEFPINNLVSHFPTSVLWPENVSNTHFI